MCKCNPCAYTRESLEQVVATLGEPYVFGDGYTSFYGSFGGTGTTVDADSANYVAFPNTQSFTINSPTGVTTTVYRPDGSTVSIAGDASQTFEGSIYGYAISTSANDTVDIVYTECSSSQFAAKSEAALPALP